MDNSKNLGKEMRGLGAVINQTGNLAMAFGNTQLGAAIGGLENTVESAKRLSHELGNSKIAFAALASAAIGGGVTIGNSIRQYVPIFNEIDNLQRATAAADKIQDVQLQQLALRDEAAAAAATHRIAAMRQIRDLQNQSQFFGLVPKAPSPEEADLVAQIKKLQADREIKIEEDKEKTIGDMIRQSKADILTLENDTLGAMAQENVRYQETIRSLEENRVIDAEGRDTLLEDAERAHQLRMSQIHQAAQDKIIAQEKAKFAVQENYARLAANVFGSLAAVAQAFGKKGFAAFKAFKIAEAIASTYESAVNSYAWASSFGGPAAGAVAAAAAIAAGLANVATISATKPSGQAHSGLEYVPSDSTFYLQQGERVIAKNQNQQLTDWLEGSGGAGPMISVQVMLEGSTLFRAMGKASRDGRLVLSAKSIS